jgi:hypothetical protein
MLIFLILEVLIIRAMLALRIAENVFSVALKVIAKV